MAHRNLDDMRITLQRTVMASIPEGAYQSVAMAVLQAVLRQRMAIRRDIQEGIDVQTRSHSPKLMTMGT